MLCVHVCHCVRELLTVDFGLRLVQLKLFVEQVIYNLDDLEEVMVTTTLTDILNSRFRLRLSFLKLQFSNCGNPN